MWGWVSGCDGVRGWRVLGVGHVGVGKGCDGVGVEGVRGGGRWVSGCDGVRGR